MFVIEPPTGWFSFGLSDIWPFRELVYFLGWRDIKVRYKQAFIGAAWAVLQPVIMMVIFTLFLGRVAHVVFPGVPYAVGVFCGLLPWTFFANSVAGASDSLVANANLVSKVYFPRLVMPAGSIVAWLPDLGIASVVLIGLMAIYRVVPHWTTVFLPLFVLFAIFASASVGVWFSALNVAYRDVRYAVPFLIQVWLFATPVVYPISAVPEQFRFLYALNPMVGVVQGFRWCLLGPVSGSPDLGMIAVSAVATLVLLCGGLLYFKRVEHFFADVI